MSTTTKINYIELPAKDFDATEAFYSSAFGWAFTPYGPNYRAFRDGSMDGGFYLATEDKRSCSDSGAVHKEKSI